MVVQHGLQRMWLDPLFSRQTVVQIFVESSRKFSQNDVRIRNLLSVQFDERQLALSGLPSEPIFHVLYLGVQTTTIWEQKRIRLELVVKHQRQHGEDGRRVVAADAWHASILHCSNTYLILDATHSEEVFHLETVGWDGSDGRGPRELVQVHDVLLPFLSVDRRLGRGGFFGTQSIGISSSSFGLWLIPGCVILGVLGLCSGSRLGCCRRCHVGLMSLVDTVPIWWHYTMGWMANGWSDGVKIIMVLAGGSGGGRRSRYGYEGERERERERWCCFSLPL